MRGERGSVTVHAVTVGLLVGIVAAGFTEAGALVAMRHRAASAADLSALAASRASINGADGCAAARTTARRNHATIVRCRMDVDVATVTARTTSRRWWGHRWAAEVEARAAPDFYLGAAGRPAGPPGGASGAGRP